MEAHKETKTREEELIEATKLMLSISSGDAVLMISKLIADNEKLSNENETLKSELIRVKEDKSENEAAYERVIKRYQDIIEDLEIEYQKMQKTKRRNSHAQ